MRSTGAEKLAEISKRPALLSLNFLGTVSSGSAPRSGSLGASDCTSSWWQNLADNVEESATRYWFWKHEWITESSSGLALHVGVGGQERLKVQLRRSRDLRITDSGSVGWPPRMVTAMEYSWLASTGQTVCDVHSRAREMSYPSPSELRKQWIPNVNTDLFTLLDFGFALIRLKLYSDSLLE